MAGETEAKETIGRSRFIINRSWAPECTNDQCTDFEEQRSKGCNRVDASVP